MQRHIGKTLSLVKHAEGFGINGIKVITKMRCRKTSEGVWRIIGHIDIVLNVSGVRHVVPGCWSRPFLHLHPRSCSCSLMHQYPQSHGSYGSVLNLSFDWCPCLKCGTSFDCAIENLLLQWLLLCLSLIMSKLMPKAFIVFQCRMEMCESDRKSDGTRVLDFTLCPATQFHPPFDDEGIIWVVSHTGDWILGDAFILSYNFIYNN